jgi:hypothetical protein
MTLIPEGHDALAGAVAGEQPRGSRGWPAGRTLLIAAGAIVISGSAIAATGGWRPILGDDHRGHPQPARTSVPSAQLAALGVLRRQQTAADRSPDVRRILRLLPRREINGIHIDAIRVLRQRSDGASVLIPTEREGSHDPGYPSSIQRRVLCLFMGVTRTPRSSQVVSHGQPSTEHLPGGVSAGATCGNMQNLRTTGISLTVSSDRGFILGGLVPDGVERVVIRLRHQRLIKAPVRDNYYEINTGNEVAPGWPVRWINAQGQTIDHSRDHPYP